MKKFFAVVLAVVMAMSMASVSFADLWVNATPYDLIVDENYLREGGIYIQYGDTVYFNIYDDVDYGAADFGGDNIANYKFMEKTKIKTTFEMGEEIVDSVSLVKMPASIEGAPEFTEYFIAVKLAKKDTTAETDVVGTFEIERKAVKIDGKEVSPKADFDVDFAFSVAYTRNWVNEADKYLVDGDEVILCYDTPYALKFDCDEEVEFQFGDKYSALNEGTFTVDVSGQGKIFVKWNTTADKAVAAANEGVDMRFVNFNNVKFNRAGEFMYEMENGVAAYQVVDGALVEIPGCEYDAADEAFYFHTSVLGNYVFADAELVNPVA